MYYVTTDGSANYATADGSACYVTADHDDTPTGTSLHVTITVTDSPSGAPTFAEAVMSWLKDGEELWRRFR